MKKTALFVALSAAFSAQATQTETDTIVVTANRTQQAAFDALAQIDTFERSDIELLQPTSLADLINRIAGVNNTAQGTPAHQTSTFVRGANSDHLLILIDGVRIGSATLGQKQIADIAIQQIEKVEIVRGPRAALWGSDAMGGVIQIFTRQLSPGEAQINLGLGSNRFKQLSAAMGLGNDTHQISLAASAEGSQGFDVIKPDPNNPFAVDQPDDDGYKRQSLAINSQHQITSSLNLDFVAQQDKGTTEIDSSFGGDETDYTNYFAKVGLNYQLQDIKLSANASMSQDENEDNASEISPGTLNNQFETERDQLSLLGQWQVSRNTDLSVGADWYEESISSHNDNTLMDYSDKSRHAQAYFLMGQHQWQAIALEASLRHDKVGDIDSETTYQMGLGYALNASNKIAITRGTAFKAPTFNDLFWPDAFGSRGNPNLESETATNTEILYKHQSQALTVNLSLYETQFDNLIEWSQIDPNDPFAFEPQNVDAARIKGAELSLSTELVGATHNLSLSHIEAINEQTQQQLQRRPHFSAFYQWRKSFQQWETFAEADHQGRRSDSGQPLASYTLFNLGVSYALSSQAQLQLKINNLLDKSYQQAYQYPGADRTVRLSLSYSL